MANRGTYATLADLKTDLSIIGTADDARLLARLEEASRQIDDVCHRWFFVWSNTRYFTARNHHYLSVTDLLSIDTSGLATDPDDDRDYDDIWTAADYDLEPANEWPKYLIRATPLGSYRFPSTARGVRIAGQWGYGDGSGATPYVLSTTTIAEDLDASETGIDVASGTPHAVGQTILIGSEQMYITAVSTNTLTVERAVNGTTAATHASGTATYIYQYPRAVSSACRLLAARLHNRPNAPFGVTGSVDLGMIRVNPRDPDIVGPLEPYMLVGVA
jgi:hypothetical protein